MKCILLFFEARTKPLKLTTNMKPQYIHRKIELKFKYFQSDRDGECLSK